MNWIKGGLLFLAFALLTGTYSAQTERDVFITANELFTSEKYVEATPYYLRLLSLKPKNTFINYRYGACLLFNSDRKLEAMRYLKYAVANFESDPMALYYLARSCHYNYLFNEALFNYQQFEQKATKKQIEKLEIERLKSMCQNGQLLLTKYSELVVFEKKEIEISKFFRLYDLKEWLFEKFVPHIFPHKL